MGDKPLLLLVIEIPYIIFLKLYHFTGAVFALPFYFVLKSTQPLTFSPIFSKNYKLAALFMLPRAILLLLIFTIPFIISGGVSLACYYWLTSIIERKVWVYAFTSLCFSLAITHVSKGTRKMNAKYKCPLKSWQLYFKAGGECIIGMLSIVLALITLLLYVQHKKLFKRLNENSNPVIKYKAILLCISILVVRSILFYVGTVLYIFSYITVWRRPYLMMQLKSLTKSADQLKALCVNLLGFILDLVITPLAIFPLISGTRTLELLNGLDPYKGNEWYRHIAYEVRETFYDFLVLFPLIGILITFVNFPFLLVHMWKYGTKYPLDKKMMFLRRSIIQHFTGVFTIVIPIAVMAVLNVPLMIVYTWRRDYLHRELAYNKISNPSARIRAILHYYFMRNIRVMLRDSFIIPSALLTIIFMWRIRIFKKAFHEKFYSSKEYFKWTIRHLAILTSDLFFAFLLLLHLPHVFRWRYGYDILEAEVMYISGETHLKESRLKLRSIFNSALLCFLDIILLPANIILLVTVIRAPGLYRIYSFPSKLVAFRE